jgi:large subunit ribosomal protein L22
VSKQVQPRRLQETEASAYARALRGSPRKLNLVAQSIRGLPASRALSELTFSRRRIALEVRKVLQSAIANAENNHQLDVDRLYVKEATVGRAFVLERFHVRGRGRISPVQKYFANLLVVVHERAEQKVEKVEAKPAADDKAADAAPKRVKPQAKPRVKGGRDDNKNAGKSKSKAGAAKRKEKK